ncbi:MAG: F0F1 ATP synthase subunit delta [Candidatus Pacebacteria bacterium]|nr:F0F1 ATP synthase subunit delta [Candidatus Paceibacterota bacterium]
MNYKKYAKIIFQASQEKTEGELNIFMQNFFSLLKEKKEVKILPKLYNELEKIIQEEERSNQTIIILKNENLLNTYKEELKKFDNTFNQENIKIQKNENIIGGFIAKNKKYTLNNSYRKKLFELYQKITS